MTKRPAPEDVTTEPIGDGQRTTSLAANREMALEVRAPHRVRRVVPAEVIGVRRAAASALWYPDEAMFLENSADGAGDRQLELGSLPSQYHERGAPSACAADVQQAAPRPPRCSPRVDEHAGRATYLRDWRHRHPRTDGATCSQTWG